MAIDVKSIVCPQCGSNDVNMTSETQGVCKSCGTQFAVKQQIETQNVYNEFYINTDAPAEEDEGTQCTKSEIISEYSEDEFIRKAWIQLVKEDAPLEVFSENFTITAEREHQVLIDTVSADVTYQASVGYDRQEPYIAYEDYWEKEPYITTESYYDHNTKSTRTRQVTKYKDVKKQRQVTKYKTVTDWSAFSGRHTVNDSVAIVENLPGEHLDKTLFRESFTTASDSSFIDVSEELAKTMVITESAQKEANSLHSRAIDSSVSYSLPGDHHKNLDWNIAEITSADSSLYKVPEYTTSICFDGKTYAKHAFPFGTMSIGGDTIPNEVSLEAITEQMEDKLYSENSERNKSIEKIVSKATNFISMITIAILIAFILVSILIRSTALMVILFLASIAAFIFNSIVVKSKLKEETARVEAENDEATRKAEAEIADYSKNYKIKQRDLLDNKLKSLGYEPVTADEL